MHVPFQCNKGNHSYLFITSRDLLIHFKLRKPSETCRGPSSRKWVRVGDRKCIEIVPLLIDTINIFKWGLTVAIERVLIVEVACIEESLMCITRAHIEGGTCCCYYRLRRRRGWRFTCTIVNDWSAFVRFSTCFNLRFITVGWFQRLVQLRVVRIIRYLPIFLIGTCW